MGDIQAFSQTAIFNMDMAAFFSKWVQDIRDSQADDGRYPDFAPHVSDPNQGFSGVPAWGDAGVIIPWRMYVNYGDTRGLEEHYPSAKRWIDFIHKENPNLLWLNARGNDYNDWLSGDSLVCEGWSEKGAAVPKPVFATAFFAHSAETLAKMAEALGRTLEAMKYRKLFEGIRAAFQDAYVKKDGRVEGDTQAGYALALRFGLMPENLRGEAVKHMIRAIEHYRGHLSTGIQSTHRLLLELTRNGFHREACRLIQLTDFPSWGYMIQNGATTIWERWDGYVKGRGFQNPGMNSFNHWAFGSVGEWMWRHLAGINPDEEHPGFKHFRIQPLPGGGLRSAKGEYRSIRGRILSSWRIAGGRFTLDVTIPPNTTATVVVPSEDSSRITEGELPVEKRQGVRFLRHENGASVFLVESGRYTFNAPFGKD